MMDRPDAKQIEDNTALLIRAAMEPGARPSAEQRWSMLRRLLHEQARSAHVAFPDAVVVLLGGLLLAVAGILAWLQAQGAPPLAENPALLLPAVGLLLNLVLVPVAGIVIVLGRKHE